MLNTVKLGMKYLADYLFFFKKIISQRQKSTLVSVITDSFSKELFHFKTIKYLYQHPVLLILLYSFSPSSKRTT